LYPFFLFGSPGTVWWAATDELSLLLNINTFTRSQWSQWALQLRSLMILKIVVNVKHMSAPPTLMKQVVFVQVIGPKV
jgi:hypothetical protein